MDLDVLEWEIEVIEFYFRDDSSSCIWGIMMVLFKLWCFFVVKIIYVF